VIFATRGGTDSPTAASSCSICSAALSQPSEIAIARLDIANDRRKRRHAGVMARISLLYTRSPCWASYAPHFFGGYRSPGHRPLGSVPEAVS